MKANELRIGNLVKLEGISRPIKVSIIDTTETSTNTKYKPIPLTEEWLLKCGFEYCDTVTPKAYWLNGVCIEKVDSMFIEFSYGIVLKYLHQLQNLYFALTGEELNIEL